MSISKISSVIIISVIIVVSAGSVLILAAADAEETGEAEKTEEERPDEITITEDERDTDSTEKTDTITSYSVRYYNNGTMVREVTVKSGSKITTIDFTESLNPPKKFLGWSTNPSNTENIYPSGYSLTVNSDISLYAVISEDIRTFYIVTLPPEEDQLSTGYRITAEPTLVPEGGKCTLTYTLLIGYSDDNLVITVNGSPVERDGSNKIHISNIKENLFVAVNGIRNTRSYDVSVPEEQIGYSLIVSSSNINHGGSYEITYSLNPHYTETQGKFKISINGGKALSLYQGHVTVSNVTNNQTITVEGVEPTNYKITAGKNTKLTVNGVQAQTARFNDIVIPVSDNGYDIPSNYGACVPETVVANGGGYSVKGDSVFPSIAKIEMGDNILVAGQSKKSFFVCTEDVIVISYPGGLPSSYRDTILDMPGVSSKGNGFCFSNNTKLPGVYTITYQGHTTVHEVLHETEGLAIPVPGKTPERVGYIFNKWILNETIVSRDLNIIPDWTPLTITASFGINLVLTLDNGSTYLFDDSSMTSNNIQIKANEKFKIETIFELELPDYYGPDKNAIYEKDGWYRAVGDCKFPGVTYVVYHGLTNKDSEDYFSVTIGEPYSVKSKPSWNNPGYEFIGWELKGVKITSGQIEIINSKYLLVATWRPIT